MSETKSAEEDQLPLSIGKVDLGKKAEEDGIKYFYTSVCSLNYGAPAPLIPREAIRKMQMNGFHIYGFLDFGLPTSNADIFGVPDPESLIQFPWDPAYAWTSCNLYFKDKPLPQCPRRVLQKQIDKAREVGLVVKTGMEVEFMLMKKDCLEPFDETEAVWRYQDPVLEMRNAAFITSVLDAMNKLGWGPYSAEHEAMAAQYEINYNYADAMTSSDRYTFLKFMIKHLAEKQGMRATFMPAPFQGEMAFGSGLHIHFSIWNAKDDINVTGDRDGELGLSQTGRHFLGGLMKHLPALTAIGCSQINSYKRLHAFKNFLNLCSYGRDSKHPAVRIVCEHGDYNRFELRMPDPPANPYLLNAAIIAAGLDGIENSIEPDPVQQMEADLFEKETPEGIKTLPRSLNDALEILGKDEVLIERLGQEVIHAYIGVKKFQLEMFMKEVTPFEKKMLEVY